MHLSCPLLGENELENNLRSVPVYYDCTRSSAPYRKITLITMSATPNINEVDHPSTSGKLIVRRRNSLRQ